MTMVSKMSTNANSSIVEGQTDPDSQEWLPAVETFLDGFRRLGPDRDRSGEEFCREFGRIRDHLKYLKQSTLGEGLVSAPEFNVFRVLGLSRDEVRTHSAMLVHLLNPRQAHGQQFLFLKSFLEYSHRKDPEFPLPSQALENAHWEVFPEYVTTSHGRIDIVIRNTALGYIVVIENKVDAWEQTDQVKRYSCWLKSQKQDYPNQGLIFLTLQGSRAYTGQGVHYLRMSYHHDIAIWLTDISGQIQAPHVRTVIAQYAALVRDL